ncbi:MAG: hypothetical protein ACOYNV_25415 [Propionivibrio sp.]
MVHTQSGEKRIKRMIADYIEAARQRGDLKHAATLRLTLRHFIETHYHETAQ